MNGTTKQRYISTSIWSDDWFDSLSEREKLVYFYLLTNEHTNAAGVYQCTLKNVRLEMGMNRDEIEVVMDKFATDGKAFYYKEYIIIPKWLKHQKIKERSGLFLGAVKVLKNLPEEIKYFISDRRHYDYDISSIIKTDLRDSQEPLKTLPSENKDHPHENNIPSQDPPQKNGTPSQDHPPKTTAQTVHDSDSEFDSEFEFDINSGGSEFLKRLDTSPPPQELYQKIKSLAIHVGFAIDDELAKHLSSRAYNPEWFAGDLSFLHFVYSRITTSSKYSKLESAEQRSLLFSALWNRNGKWSDLFDEYPVWHDKKLTEQQNIIKQKAKLNSKPVTCECGQALGASGKCHACGSWFEWEDDEWHFVQGISFSGNLFDQVTKSHVPKISADEFPDEIDF